METRYCATCQKDTLWRWALKIPGKQNVFFGDEIYYCAECRAEETEQRPIAQLPEE
jgi:hypothetical protein